MKYFTPLGTIFSAKSTTGIGTTINTEGYEEILFEFSTAGTSTLTVKFKGSISDTAPDFSASASESNLWEHLAFTRVDATSAVAGSTGISTSAADIATIIRVNAPHLKCVNADVTSRSAGTVTVKVIGVKTKYV